MTDYGALADKLKSLGQAAKAANNLQARPGIDLNAFFDSVKTQIDEEAQKANKELGKRGLPLMERIFVPGFLGKLSLTFGTDLLCTVDLQEEQGRITAVISGPPNRREIARKEFQLVPEAAEWQPSPLDQVEKAATGFSAEEIAAEIVSRLLVAGVQLTQKRSPDSEPSDNSSPIVHEPRLLAEFWSSLASLLRSYTSAHGLSRDRQAEVEAGEQKIMVRHGKKWLRLERDGAKIAWKRENGTSGTLELTDHGSLRGPGTQEQELDMAAEAWARDLMQDQTPDQL